MRLKDYSDILFHFMTVSFSPRLGALLKETLVLAMRLVSS